MNAFKKSKRTIKSVAVTATTLALVAAPTAAFAHGGGHEGSNQDSGHRTAAAQQAQQKQKNNGQSSDWWHRNKDRQKLTCSQRQDALNQRAADAKAKYTKKLNGLSIISGGIQPYVDSGDVVVPNYDAMKAQVAADQTAATNAVNAIAAPQLNCDDANSATAMSDDNKTWHDHDNSTNNSISAAQQALNTYRKDLNNLVEAVINS